MSTNPTFTADELTLIHKTLIKARSIMFDAREIKFDRKSFPKIRKGIPTWRGERGTCPPIEDIDKAIALMRVHINSEEAIQLYDAMGMFDQPKKEGPKPLSSNE